MCDKVYLSAEAGEDLREYLRSQGFDIESFGPVSVLPEGLACHPDLAFCRLTSDALFCGDISRLGAEYPADIMYNACSTGKYFIHNLKYTAAALLNVAKVTGLQLIDVPQGYAKCSISVVSEDAIITYDRGIAGALKDAVDGCVVIEGSNFDSADLSASANLDGAAGCADSADLDGAAGCADSAAVLKVLLIEPEHIELPGYNTGFIGGCSGLDRKHGELIFNGGLDSHPDGGRIRAFAKACGVKVKDFPGRPLVDIGSIVF